MGAVLDAVGALVEVVIDTGVPDELEATFVSVPQSEHQAEDQTHHHERSEGDDPDEGGTAARGEESADLESGQPAGKSCVPYRVVRSDHPASRRPYKLLPTHGARRVSVDLVGLDVVPA